MTSEKSYNDFGSWIRNKLPYRIQKISIDAGFSCPNRDGRIGTGGCIYCDNRTFNPSYCDSRKTVREQIEEGKKFFSKKYPDMKYLAYFQAFTNTYAPIDTLKKLYGEALEAEDVKGIVIGTRPDCVTEELLDYLSELSRHVLIIIEYGIESANDNTLARINRGHDFSCVKKVVNSTAERGITCGGHVILGLPGESREDIIRQAPVISSLKLDILKIHQMQIIRGTRLAEEYASHPFQVYSVEEYVGLLAEYIQHLRPSLVLERFVSQSPADMLVAPKWGLKNHEFTNMFNNYLARNGIRQGQKSLIP